MAENQDNSYSHILKYTGVFGGVQGLNILVAVLRNKFAALFLGPSGMGLLSLFNSTVSFISSAMNLGIPTTGVKTISEKCRGLQVDEIHEPSAVQESIAMVRTISLLSALGGMVLTAVFASHVLLSPIVFFAILAGGETAILKATRQLRALAASTALLAVISLLVSIPIYWLWGERGILVVLFLLAFCQWGIAFCFATRKSPMRLNFSKSTFLRAIPMLRLGMAFVLAAMLNSGAELLVRVYLSRQASLEVVGLFNAGVTIVLVYVGMVFSVMESDYYPRLSAIPVKGDKLNLCVNRQLEMNVLLIGPILASVVLALPIIVPLLYAPQFAGMVLMTQIAALGMLFRAVYLPIEYLPLARGDSWFYLFQESIAVLLLVLGELLGFCFGGLEGLGAGIVLAYAVESVGVVVQGKWRYGYRMSHDGVWMFVIQGLLAAVLLCVVMYIDYHELSYWLLGALLLLLSLIFSYGMLRSKLR